MENRLVLRLYKKHSISPNLFAQTSNVERESTDVKNCREIEDFANLEIGACQLFGIFRAWSRVMDFIIPLCFSSLLMIFRSRYPGEREAPFLRVSMEFHVGTKTERSLCDDDPVVVMKTKGRAQLPVPLFSYATFLAYFTARRFQETGISHRIDVNVNVTVE